MFRRPFPLLLAFCGILFFHGLTAGDLVTTGTCITPVPVAPGDTFRADFGEFGSVQVKLV